MPTQYAPGGVTRSTSPPAKYKYHCFISYTTREDEVQRIKPLVDDFVDRLRAAEVVVCPVFYDGWYLERRRYQRADLAERLYTAIEHSAFTVAFLSPGYVASPWCRFEWMTTLQVHESRDYPALEYSILPVLWKPLRRVYLREPCRLLRRQIGDRLSASAQRPWQPDRAPAVDVTNCDVTDWHGSAAALSRAVAPVPIYLDRWYPGQDWKIPKPFPYLSP